MDASMKAKRIAFSALLFIFLTAAGVYADVPPYSPLIDSDLTSVLVIVILAGAVIALLGIVVISWLVIKKMRKKNAAEKPVDGALKEQG